MSTVELVMLAVIVLLGSFLQASIGFGLGMLAGPVMALIEPSLVPAGVMLLATGVTLSIVLLDRSELDLRGTGWALLGRVPGVIAGAALVAVLPTRILNWCWPGWSYWACSSRSGASRRNRPGWRS